MAAIQHVLILKQIRCRRFSPCQSFYSAKLKPFWHFAWRGYLKNNCLPRQLMELLDLLRPALARL